MEKLVLETAHINCFKCERKGEWSERPKIDWHRSDLDEKLIFCSTRCQLEHFLKEWGLD